MLIQTVYRALLTSAVSGIVHLIHTPKKSIGLHSGFSIVIQSSQSSLMLYSTLHPEYKYADYFFAVKCYSNARM